MIETAALAPYGLALRAFADGDRKALLIIRREDGLEVPLPASHFFRPAEAFFPIEQAALARCRGRVLDVGAGTGLHTLDLQARDIEVLAIDVSPVAVELMRERGVADARCIDFFALRETVFDTVLLLGHGIGMVSDLDGLHRFLAHARSVVTPAGRVLLHSLDVRATSDPDHLAYHETTRQAGRYEGTIRMRFLFDGVAGPPCEWLHIDPVTLAAEARAAGWSCNVILQEASGDYLAELSPEDGGTG